MNTSRRSHIQTGFTLVELMVSLALGLLIVLALITLLINVNRNNTEMTKVNRVIENGRFALQVLEADIAHAGFWGGFVPQFDDLTLPGIPADVPTALPDPCLAYSVTNWTPAYKSNLVGISVQGYEISSPVPSPTLSVCAARVVSPKANTDVLIVRHAENGVTAANPADGDLYFQVARCGEVMPSPPYVMDTTVAAFTLQNRDCATIADLRKFVSSIYYIRDYAVTVGDGIPTLMRSQFGPSSGTVAHQPAQPLIEGIEGFRVEFGIDNLSDTNASVNFGQAVNWYDPAYPATSLTRTLNSPSNRGNGIPDGNFVRCTTASPCTFAQLMNAVAIKIHILVRSENTTPGYVDTKTYALGPTTLGPFNDGFKRHLFSQTVRLINPASRRETP